MRQAPAVAERERRDAVHWIDSAMLGQLLMRAGAHPRRRLNLNFHVTPDENPHRFLNALLRGTYVRPHRHLFPPKPESFIVLSGAILFLLFDGAGEVTSGRVLAAPGSEWDAVRPEFAVDGHGLGVDIEAGLWHTLLPLSPESVIFEVKPGPYLPADDKEFAAWAPAEGAPDAASYMDSLYRRCLAYGDAG